MKSYNVVRIEKNKLILTGKGDNPCWDNAEALTHFISAWDKDPIKKIEFKSLCDSEKIFFCFKVYDGNVHINTKDNSVESIGNSDRVELFFRTNKDLNPYYCLEIDPTPRILDFMALPNKNFDFKWNWPKNDICVKSSIEKESFIVEISISIDSLKKLNLIKGNLLETGIFRAKYLKKKNGDFEPTWISWVDPSTNEPNFHIASSFGVLKLEEEHIN